MKKAELLIPVGNYECLEAAVLNGADAVYFAGKNFGARKYASNFDNEEIIKAIKYAHLYGVKVYITVNTIIYEEEVNDFIKYVEFLYVSGVDALIMQDLGMIKLVHDKCPDLEIHASTQMHNTNSEGIKYLESLGIKRLVFARELTLEQINKIKTPMEKEVFIHGALCVCYSGQCLFSSLVGGRSGNRGECAGSCRLPYTLYENGKKVYADGKYLLSTKELSSLDTLKEILDSGIDSLKVEGRMKGKTYVAFVTRLYRTLIDKYYNNEKMEVTKQDKKNLELIFNREFTSGYLFNNRNKDIINIKTPNHKGLLIGKVLSVKDKVKMELYEELNQNDGIRFTSGEGMIVNFLYDERGKLTSSVKAGSICYVDKKFYVDSKDDVYKTLDSKLEETIINYEVKKVPVKLKVKAKYNELLEVSYDYVTLKGNIVQSSINRPSTKEDILRSLSKLGNTPFEVSEYEIDVDDNVFISVSELNELRRKCIEILTTDKESIDVKANIKNITKEEYKCDITNEISVLVRNEAHLKYVLTKDIDIVYVTDYSLYQKYSDDKRVVYRTIRAPKFLNEFNNTKLLVSELGAFNKYKDNNNVTTDAYFNIVNSFALFKLLKDGAKKVTLSYELTYDKIERMLKDYAGKYKHPANVEVVVYGKPELMISEYCLLNTLMNKETPCKFCKNNRNIYEIEDRVGEKYRVLNENCLTYILHYKNIDMLNNIEYLKELGVTNFRIDLLDETEEEIDKILSKFVVL